MRYTVDWWQERDRASVVVTDSRDRDVWELWDDDVYEMIADGFFKWEDDQSVIDYLSEVGIIREKASSKTAKCPTCGNKYLVATGYCLTCKKKVKGAKKKDDKKKSESRDASLTIQQEVELPGTDIVLEKGDRVEIVSENSLSEDRQALKSVLAQYTRNKPAFEAGLELGGDLYALIDGKYTTDLLDEFVRGFQSNFG